MGDVENLNLGELDNGKELVDELNENRKNIPLVDNEDLVKKGPKKGSKYKQKSWDEYCEEQKKIFDEVSIEDPINSAIKISGIPNKEEFDRMVTILKDENGGREFEFICTEYGYDRFYYIYKKTGFFDIVKVVRQVNDTFYSEYFRTFIQLNLTGSIPDRNKGGKEFYLHMSKRQKAIINRTLKDFNGNEGQFGLICCIFTFNRAQEKFQYLTTDKFKVYYQDSGYAKIILEEMSEASKKAISRLAEGFPILINELDEKGTLAANKDLQKSSEIKKNMEYGIDVVNDVYELLVKNGVNVPILQKLNLEVIEEKAKGTYIPYVD